MTELNIKTQIGNVQVSTVKLPTFPGLDVQFWTRLGGKYETCIFFYDTHDSEVVERYPTKHEAKIGHAKWVKEVKSGKTNAKDFYFYGE